MCKKPLHPTAPTFLTKYFTLGFDEILSTFTSAEKQKILDISPLFFKKWYYSTFFEDTVLSPANILNSYYTKNKNEVAYISYKVDPSARGNGRFSYHLATDSIADHSFIKNLVALTDYCLPAAAFDEGGMYPFLIPENLIEKLTTTDGFYFEYLIQMAQRFNLITAMPSINTCKYQKNAEKCQRFFSQGNIQILTQLTNEALELFNEKFTEILQMPNNILNPMNMRSFLATSILTDDIYKKVFTALGFHFDNMVEMAEMSILSPENETILASAYFLGTLLDKWFFSPLGHYLKLITPLYSVPYDFTDDTDYVRPILLTDCDVSGDVFSPCNYYSLTPIGEEILGYKNANPQFQNLWEDFTQEQIQLFLSSILHINHVNIPNYVMQNNVFEVYTIKVSYANRHLFWKTIQVPSDYPITKLYDLIATYFGFDKSDRYIFYIESKNDTTTSCSPINKASRFRLNELLPNNNLLLSDEDNDFPNLVLSLIKVGRSERKVNYPRLLRQSKAITKEEQRDTL